MISRKTLLITILITALFTGAVVFYVATKKPLTASDSKPIKELSASALIIELSNNKKVVDSTYMYKNISVAGKIKEISGTNLILDAGETALVNCSFDSTTFESVKRIVKPGEEIIVNGIYFGCSGFDAESDGDLDLIPIEKEAKLRTCALIKPSNKNNK
jgi:hypothetical protein